MRPADDASIRRHVQEQVRDEYRRLGRIVQTDPVALERLTEQVLPVLVELLEDAECGSRRQLEWRVRRVLHGVDFHNSSGDPATDESLRLTRELHVRVLVRALANLRRHHHHNRPEAAPPMCG